MSPTQPALRLELLPQEKLRALLETGVPVYLSVNPVEFHGPHLPLDTDALLSEAMIRETHAALPELSGGLPPVIAEPIPYGCNAAHGPGTEETPYRRLREMVLARCQRLAELGARRVILMTFHGGPFHNLALWDGVCLLERLGVRAIAPFNLLFQAMVDFRPDELREVFAPIADPVVREESVRGFVDDYHAGFWETSLMLHFWQESVSESYRALPPCPAYRPQPLAHAIESLCRRLGLRRLAAELHFVSMGLGWNSLKPRPPGYTGRPHLAHVESGRAFARLLTARYAAAIRACFSDGARAPEPILRFLLPLSLGGRIMPR